MKYYPAEEVARFFLIQARDKGDFMSNKKLQKLLYYAQAWCLALSDRPLFENKIEAWLHGPVVPEVYQKYKKYGWKPISPPKKKIEDLDWPPKVVGFLQQVFSVYGDHSAEYLERLAHSEKPWREARGDSPLEVYSNTEINIETMKNFYKSKLKKNGARL